MTLPSHPAKPPSWYTSATTTAATARPLQTAIHNTQPYRNAVQSKRKKAKEVTSVGGSTAIARSLMMQGLYLFYRTPVKVGRTSCAQTTMTPYTPCYH